MKHTSLAAAAAILLAAAGAAQAGTMFSMRNKAGGEIRLTDDTIECRDGERYMYATAPSGRTLTGCWAYSRDDGIVFIRWDDTGKITTHPAADFSTTPYGRRVIDQQKTTTTY